MEREVEGVGGQEDEWAEGGRRTGVQRPRVLLLSLSRPNLHPRQSEAGAALSLEGLCCLDLSLRGGGKRVYHWFGHTPDRTVNFHFLISFSLEIDEV